MQEVVVTHRGHLASEPTASGEADSVVSFHWPAPNPGWLLGDLHTLTKMCFSLLRDTAMVL